MNPKGAMIETIAAFFFWRNDSSHRKVNQRHQANGNG